MTTYNPPSYLNIEILQQDGQPIYRVYIGPYDNTTGIDQYLYFNKDQLKRLTDFLVNYLAEK
jgi:hypothetical protein